MRVQSADEDPRFIDAEFRLQIVVQDAHDFQQQLLRDGIGDIAQRQVGGRERYAQSRTGEHHQGVTCSFLCKIFRVAGKGDPCVVDNALVQWSSYHGRECSAAATVDCSIEY